MLIDRGKKWCDSFIQHCILQGNTYIQYIFDIYALIIDKDNFTLGLTKWYLLGLRAESWFVVASYHYGKRKACYKKP